MRFSRSTGGEPPAIEVQVADSAGVRLVRVPPLSTFQLPEIRHHVAFSTRDFDNGPLELFRVSDGLFLDDGTLVLANSGSSEVILIDGDGRTAVRVGRTGEGPGEFRQLQALLPKDGQQFYAFDALLSLLSLFTADGDFVETRRFDPPSPVVSLIPLAVLGDQSIVGVTGGQRIFRSDGVRRDTVPLLVFRGSDTAPDTLGKWLGLERAFASVPAGSLLVPIGFARTVYHASNGAEVAISSSDSISITVYSDSLLPRLYIVAPREARLPTERDVNHWQDEMSKAIPWENPDIRRAWDAAPVRNQFPGFDGLLLDPDGRLWVGAYPSPGDEERRWVLFSREGVPIAQIGVPMGPFRTTPGRTEVLAVGRNRMAVLRRTRVDEEYVEVWTFELRIDEGDSPTSR